MTLRTSGVLDSPQHIRRWQIIEINLRRSGDVRLMLTALEVDIQSHAVHVSWRQSTIIP